MKIGVDCRKIFNPITNEGAGIERYVFNLVKNLIEIDENNQYVLFVPKRYPQEALDILIKRQANVKLIPISDGKIPFFSNHLLFALELRRASLDLAIFPANTIPIGYNRRSFLFIHDLIIYKHPEWFPAGQFFSRKIAVPLSIKKSDKILAISQAVKTDLEQLFGVQSNKIKIIYPSIDIYTEVDEETENKIIAKYNLKKRYIFFVGTIEPRKNLENLIRAFTKISSAMADVDLYIAGNIGWHYERIFQAAKTSGGKSNIRFLGAVSNREKLVLMKEAMIFAFISWDEGFGMPVLEAMKIGLPVITSSCGGLGELVYDQRQIVRPGDVNDIAAKLKNLLEDQEIRKNIIEKQRKWAENFSWRISVQKLLKIIEGEQ